MIRTIVGYRIFELLREQQTRGHWGKMIQHGRGKMIQSEII